MAKEIKYQLDREQYEDFSESTSLTLGDLKRKYRNKINPKKKVKGGWEYKLNLLLRHKITKWRLLDLKNKNIFDFFYVKSDNDEYWWNKLWFFSFMKALYKYIY